MTRDQLQRVTYVYASSPDPVTTGLDAFFPEGWTGVIGPNGFGKTTLLRLLSGERKQAQIATALRRRPRVLGLDEPTNHIHADARRMLITALRRFRGIGLLVSHDQRFLERLANRWWRIENGRLEVDP